MIIGYLKLTESFALGKTTQFKSGRVGKSYDEFPKGLEVPVNSYYRGISDLLVKEGIVEIYDANHKPCTWNKIEKKFDDPFCSSDQRPLIINEVKANTRPVKKSSNKLK